MPKSDYRPWTWVARILATALLAVAAGPSAASAGTEPLCDWLSGIGESAQALAEGRPALAERAARRALAARRHSAAGARASAALGLALAARGEPADAAAALEVGLAPSTATARAHLAFARATALLGAGDAPAAARLFALASGTDLALAPRARLAEAEALLAAGLATEAVPALEVFAVSAGERERAPALLALARGRRALGDEAGAVAAYRAVWLAADRPEALAAGDGLAAWRAAGGPVPSATGEDHLARAERLLATARYEQALHELAVARDASTEEEPAPSDRLETLRALALLSLGRVGEAEQIAMGLAEVPDESARRAARLVLARAAARAGRIAEASARYAEVAASSAPVPGLPEWRQRELGDEAGFLAAWLYYDGGDFRRAAAALGRFARANPRSRRAEDALWFAAWSRYRLGDRAGAARALAGLARGPLADAAAYWQGRLAAGAARQRAFYRTAVATGGDGWYALLARARLRALGAPVPPASRPPARPLPEAADGPASQRLAVAVELFALGLRDEALDELRGLAALPGVRPAAPLVAQLAAFAGDAELPFRMARDHLGPTRRALRWGHPDPQPTQVESRARAFGVDHALLLAVMRRESSFRRDIRSFAGAEGLLQLLPGTAERLATVLGVPGGLGSRLVEPEVSVALGAHYLGLLTARFGDPALALAAYNAGPRAAAEWARARAGMPLDAWVESIPFRETRQYVKIVLADWAVYRELAGERPASVDPGREVKAPADGVEF
jgi:soluble lytic murein transglycosylase